MRKEYHSSNTKEVYHNNTKCTEGNNIEKRYYTLGKGSGRTLCKRCKDLNRKR